MKMKTMSEEDWIILRLLFVAVRMNHKEAFTDPDVVKSLLYLIAKYGMDNFNGYIAQLKGVTK